MEAGADPTAIVIGTTYGVITHARALRDAGIQVVGLVGRDKEKTANRAERMNIPHALTDLNAALDLPGVSAVVVATPPHTHAEISLAAIAAGKHVVCEKPFALDASQAREVYEAAQRAGIIHLLGTEYRFGTTQVALQRVVTSGAIGEPRLANFVRYLPSLTKPGIALPQWWETASCGGGWLGAAGSHLIDQVRSSLGEFASVSASTDRLSPRPAMTADDTYSLHFRLTNGCTGILQGSCAVTGPPFTSTKVAGTTGSAWVEPGEGQVGEAVWIDTGSGPQLVPDPVDVPRVPPEPPSMDLVPDYAMEAGWHVRGTDLAPFTRLYQRLRGRILGETVRDDPPAATFYDGLACQVVLDAARRAAGDGGSIRVEPV